MSKTAPITALVAGGAGFLGSHLCRFLVMTGRRVVCVDDLSTGRPVNLARLEAYPGFRFVRHDVEEPFDIPCDEVWNLACPGAAPRFLADPLRTVRTTVMGSLNLLAIARRHRARVLFASSGDVYGDPQVVVQDEDYRGNVACYGPRACHDEAKRLAETLHYEYRYGHDVDARVARLFDLYGPGMDIEEDGAVARFVGHAVRGEPLTVLGDGEQTRSVLYVEDAVRALVALMDPDRAVAAPVNVGNPYETTLGEIAATLGEIVGDRVALRRRQASCPAEGFTLCPDIGRARRLLGWEPAVDLRTGLSRTVADFARRLGTGPVDPRPPETPPPGVTAFPLSRRRI